VVTIRRTGLVLLFFCLAAVLAVGCALPTNRLQEVTVPVPVPGSMPWPQWWAQVAPQAGVKPDVPLVRRFWIKQGDQGQASDWIIELAQMEGKRLMLITLSGHGERMQIVRGAVSGRVAGLDTASFWPDLARLPAAAWPGPGEQLQVRPAHPQARYLAGEYSVYRMQDREWAGLLPGGSYVATEGDWEAQRETASFQSEAFWIWYPEK
jgi:hypothetical protein